jgi:hypothetical protein
MIDISWHCFEAARGTSEVLITMYRVYSRRVLLQDLHAFCCVQLRELTWGSLHDAEVAHPVAFCMAAAPGLKTAHRSDHGHCPGYKSYVIYRSSLYQAVRSWCCYAIAESIPDTPTLCGGFASSGRFSRRSASAPSGAYSVESLPGLETWSSSEPVSPSRSVSSAQLCFN